MESCDPIGTPMEIKDKLDLDQNGTPIDATKYHSMIGALMYLTSSRPDIVHATCLCARYQAKPTEKHLKEVKRIFRYLQGTVNTSLWYTKDSGFELTGFSDVDYVGCKDTFKSTSGGAQFLARAGGIYPGTLPLDRVEVLGSDDGVTTSLQGHRQKEGIDYDEVFAPMARIEAMRIFLAFASYMGFIVYQIVVKSAFLYGTINEEVYVSQPPGFVDPKFSNKVYKVVKALYGLHQAPKACVKTASTPIKTQKPLVKDEEAVDVDVHLYRSMTGSLMYLSASRPNIMFAVCACSRFQVTPKTSHLYVMKRIFRYLKGQLKLGLWYPKVSSFDLEAYADNDYVGANLNRKSTTGGCQFLGRKFISWQCKKKTIMATSTTEAEYVAAAHYCRQVLWIQNQLLDYGFNFMNTKIYIDNESTICIVKNPVFHSKTKHINISHHFIRDAYEKKLIQFTMSNTHQELDSPEANGFCKELETALGKDISNLLMAGRLPKTTLPTRTQVTFAFNDPLPGGKDILKLKELMYLCTQLSNKVLELESEVIDIKSTCKDMIEKLYGRVDRLEEENRVLKELHSVHSKVDNVAPIVEKEKSFKQGRIITDIDEDVEIDLEEAQAKPYRMDLEHPKKVLSIATITTEVTKVSVPRRRRGVVIQDPKETTSTVVVHSEVQSKDKGKELNADINWNAVIEQVKRSERLNDAVMKYKASKRKPLTEAQAKKNMMIYLKNMVGYKMNYFKRMTYSKIRHLFEKHYNSNQAFLEEVNEEVTVPEKKVKVEGHKREGESIEKEITKKQKINEEAEELKSHFQIISNDDDDLVKERFEKTKPNNYTDDYLLKNLKTMFEQSDVEANVWRDQKGRYGLAKIRSRKLFELCGVHCIRFLTTQMFLLVEKRYPWTHFTLEKMLNNVRLEVEKECEMSLELLRLVRRQLNEGGGLLEIMDFNILLLFFILSAAAWNYCCVSLIVGLDLSKLAIILNRLRKIYSKGLTYMQGFVLKY
nr:putative ribonuclease H-like domain-containing protein [Tanacetum cinerariifolium]